ncbi:UNVERIFIED_CONTAM: hypothetical protein K2H54_031325 [Gekko kuhli]
MPPVTDHRPSTFGNDPEGSRPKIVCAKWGGKLEWRNASSSLGQRLEMDDQGTLRIKALEEEDSGVFEARVLLASNEIHEQTFHLSVFEPVPGPQIRHQLVSKTVEGCNLTLWCLPPEKGGFNVSWKRGNQLNDLEEGLDWYQLSAGGTELHLSWCPNSSDSNVTCLLSSPMDQKSASLNLRSVCLSEAVPLATPEKRGFPEARILKISLHAQQRAHRGDFCNCLCCDAASSNRLSSVKLCQDLAHPHSCATAQSWDGTTLRVMCRVLLLCSFPLRNLGLEGKSTKGF